MFYLLATVLFSLLVAMFAMQNAATVTVSLAFWHVEASLALVVIGAAALGILAAMPIWLRLQIKQRLRLSKQAGQLKDAEQELADLRLQAAKDKLAAKPEPSCDKKEV